MFMPSFIEIPLLKAGESKTELNRRTDRQPDDIPKNTLHGFTAKSDYYINLGL